MLQVQDSLLLPLAHRFAHLKINLGCVRGCQFHAAFIQEHLYADFEFRIYSKFQSIKWHCSKIHPPDTTSSMERGARLKGSFESDNK